MKLHEQALDLAVVRRSPQGERGLKFHVADTAGQFVGRSPQGERGLKYSVVIAAAEEKKSLPARGAWIEIGRTCGRRSCPRVTPRKGSVD